jgi:hypothetical protein
MKADCNVIVGELFVISFHTFNLLSIKQEKNTSQEHFVSSVSHRHSIYTIQFSFSHESRKYTKNLSVFETLIQRVKSNRKNSVPFFSRIPQKKKSF